MKHAKLQDVVSIPDFWLAVTRLILPLNVFLVYVPITLVGNCIGHALIHLEPLF